MDGEELREVTKDANDLMITKTGTLKAEQKVANCVEQIIAVAWIKELYVCLLMQSAHVTIILL